MWFNFKATFWRFYLSSCVFSMKTTTSGNGFYFRLQMRRMWRESSDVGLLSEVTLTLYLAAQRSTNLFISSPSENGYRTRSWMLWFVRYIKTKDGQRPNMRLHNLKETNAVNYSHSFLFIIIISCRPVVPCGKWENALILLSSFLVQPLSA